MRHLFRKLLHYSTLLSFPVTCLISHCLFSLSGIVFSMVLWSRRARMLWRSRSRQRRLHPLRAEITARIRDLGGQTIHPGWNQGTILRGWDSLHRRDCARAEGKGSAPFAHAGKSHLGTDKCSPLLLMNACLLFRHGNMLNLKIFWNLGWLSDFVVTTIFSLSSIMKRSISR